MAFNSFGALEAFVFRIVDVEVEEVGGNLIGVFRTGPSLFRWSGRFGLWLRRLRDLIGVILFCWWGSS